MIEKESELGRDEEAGPEECEVKAADAEVKPGALEESPDASHPKFSEEINEAYSPEPATMVLHPEDGLPVPADERSDLAIAPAFTYDNMVCVEDARVLVEIFKEEWGFGEGVKVCPAARRLDEEVYREDGPIRIRQLSMYLEDGSERIRRRFEPTMATKRYGQLYVETEGAHVPVRPIRPQCAHYTRQVFSNDSIPDPNDAGHLIIFRNCSARRSIGGAYLSLRDEAMYACSLRLPPHQDSLDKYLDGPDTAKLRRAVPLGRLPLFIDTTTGEYRK
jgi:hypothetical protein